MGRGDISVFIFFGLVGVIGTFYLHTEQINLSLVFPAISCGVFAVAVLNINNIRDIDSDKKAGKKSIPVRIGRKKAVIYHWFLLFTGVVSAFIFTFLNYQHPFQFLYILILPLFFINARAVIIKTNSTELDPYLKQMALSTLFFVIIFGLGNLLAFYL